MEHYFDSAGAWRVALRRALKSQGISNGPCHTPRLAARLGLGTDIGLRIPRKGDRQTGSGHAPVQGRPVGLVRGIEHATGAKQAVILVAPMTTVCGWPGATTYKQPLIDKACAQF
jgi:hypothetical protein